MRTGAVGGGGGVRGQGERSYWGAADPDRIRRVVGGGRGEGRGARCEVRGGEGRSRREEASGWQRRGGEAVEVWGCVGPGTLGQATGWITGCRLTKSPARYLIVDRRLIRRQSRRRGCVGPERPVPNVPARAGDWLNRLPTSHPATTIHRIDRTCRTTESTIPCTHPASERPCLDGVTARNRVQRHEI